MKENWFWITKINVKSRKSSISFCFICHRQWISEQQAEHDSVQALQRRPKKRNKIFKSNRMRHYGNNSIVFYCFASAPLPFLVQKVIEIVSPHSSSSRILKFFKLQQRTKWHHVTTNNRQSDFSVRAVWRTKANEKIMAARMSSKHSKYNVFDRRNTVSRGTLCELVRVAWLVING